MISLGQFEAIEAHFWKAYSEALPALFEALPALSPSRACLKPSCILKRPVFDQARWI